MAGSRNLLKRLMSTLSGSPAPSRRRPRQLSPTLDGLEDRVVLSHFGHHAHHLAGSLAASTSTASTTTTGSTTSTSVTSTTSTTAGTGSTSASTTTGTCDGDGDGPGGVQDAQLSTDLQKLQTDVNTAIGGSTVTDAQRLALRTDFRAIATAGGTVDQTALKTVADNLTTALANGKYDSDPSTAASIKTAFAAAITGSGVTSAQVDQAYTDFVTVARGLNLTSTELTNLSGDQAAIQADLTRLGISTTSGHAPGQFSTLSLILGGGRDSGVGGFEGHGGHRGGRF